MRETQARLYDNHNVPRGNDTRQQLRLPRASASINTAPQKAKPMPLHSQSPPPSPHPIASEKRSRKLKHKHVIPQYSLF